MTIFSQAALAGSLGIAVLGQLESPSYLAYPSRPADIATWGQKKYVTSFVRKPRPGVVVMYGVNSPSAVVSDVYVYVLKNGGYRLKSIYFGRHGIPKMRALKDTLRIAYTRDRCVDTVRLSRWEGR